MSNNSLSASAAAMTAATAKQPNYRAYIPQPSTSTAFTIVALTDALLPLLEEVEAASYPASYCEGIPGYAKRLHAKPRCPSFVCLQCTSVQNGHADVKELADAGDIHHLRAVGYAITCRMPHRTASMLLRGRSEEEDGDLTKNKSVQGRGVNHVNSNSGDKGREDDGAGTKGGVADNRTLRPLTGGDPRLPPSFSSFPSGVAAAATCASHHQCENADTLYVHDVAVHPDFRGLGVAGALWRQIEETRLSLHLKRTSLVAVFGARTYWARHGFREVARMTLPAATVQVLDDYGDHAVFMERED